MNCRECKKKQYSFCIECMMCKNKCCNCYYFSILKTKLYIKILHRFRNFIS